MNIMRIIPVVLALLIAAPAFAAQEFVIEIKDGAFAPQELKIPAGEKVKLRIKNQESSAVEFESYELNREKIISPGGEAVVFVGPLEKGVYTYFDEFHPKTEKGKIVAE